MGIFNSGLVRTYVPKWSVKETMTFTEEEINSVVKAKVVPSNYGLSVCFTMKSTGELAYIPCDDRASFRAGDIVDMHNVRIVVLEKDGEEDICRICDL